MSHGERRARERYSTTGIADKRAQPRAGLAEAVTANRPIVGVEAVAAVALSPTVFRTDDPNAAPAAVADAETVQRGRAGNTGAGGTQAVTV